MTTIKTLPAYEIVLEAYPRPVVTPADQLGIAVGNAIDTALARFSHEAAGGRHPTASATQRLAAETLDEKLAETDVELSPDDRAKILAQIAGVIQAFRRSAAFGMRRPRTHLILINGEVGIYAQPDYWDGTGTVVEMKSYRAVPTPPDVQLQLRLFQLAFPGHQVKLLSIDRHHIPVQSFLTPVPPLTPPEERETLSLAYRVARGRGVEKVLEFIDLPATTYTLAT